MNFLKKLFIDKNELFDKSIDAHRKGDIKKAIELLLKVIDLDNKDFEAKYYLAINYVLKKDYKSAIFYFYKFKDLIINDIEKPKVKRLYTESTINFFKTVEKAANLNQEDAQKLIDNFIEEDYKKSNEAIIAGKIITSSKLLKRAGKIFQSQQFKNCKTVENFQNELNISSIGKVSALSPIGTYMDMLDAPHYAAIYASFGYAIAKASIDLLTSSVYKENLDKKILDKIKNPNGEIEDDLIKYTNPIPWELISNVLNDSGEKLLKLFLEDIKWGDISLSNSNYIKIYFIDDYVFRGYRKGIIEFITSEF